MGMLTVFKYLGLAMEAANQAADISAEIAAAKAEDSEAGTEITEKELATIAANLDDNLSTVITRICEEANLPVESVTVKIVPRV